ncbi:MAG: cytochrome C [Gammaproteobacteria bacterium SG8_47]|nr:MAG: cytochrome C [Gammaproteobacteria bacterium SG8_47]
MPVTPSQYACWLPRERFQLLLGVIRAAGYRCVGPQVRDGAIVYDTLHAIEDLPQGVSDQQSPGGYQLGESGQQRFFDWANGPQALKPLLFTPREMLWRAQRDAEGRLQFESCTPDPHPIAVIGARACDLSALALLDRHFLHGPHPDEHYGARRARLFVVGVHCTHPASTCFCASTGDGPRCTYGYDLALAELDEGFVVQARSERGVDMLGRFPVEVRSDSPTKDQLRRVDAAVNAAAAAQQRALPGRDLSAALLDQLEHPRWQEVAGRCLACGNCTAVCPTCFCHAQSEAPALDGQSSEHYRSWDSCFTQGHSYIHGLTVRADTRSRYRQWLVHKLATWHEQYGRSGCVGCGRCITWCPVGIDLTQEAAALVAVPGDV